MGKRWNREEIKLLKENYRCTKKENLIKLFRKHGYKRTWISIFKKANKTGLKKPNFKHAIDTILKETYGSAPTHVIMNRINRYLPEANWESVKMRAQRLGLSRKEYSSEQMCKNVKIPLPSEDFAWFLGVLAGDGHVRSLSDKSKSYAVILGTVSPEFEATFYTTGRKLFNLDAYRHKAKRYKINGKWRIFHTCAFSSKHIVAFLGDWKETVWPKTLEAKFHWVFKNNKYIASFIQGFFDSEGNVRKHWTKSYRIYIAIKYPSIQKFVGNMLKLLGIEFSTYSNGIWINGLEKCSKFAAAISSCIPHKERLLEEIRNCA